MQGITFTKVMNTSFEQPRRKFLQKAVTTSLSLLGISTFITSCKTDGDQSQTAEASKTEEPVVSAKAENVDDCLDFSDVSAAELDKRKALGYEDVTPFADKQCDNCQLYIPVKEGNKCGGCMLFKGPVFAEAHCTYWAPQTDA